MKKVLFLEDEEVLGKIYRKKLEAAGFEVRWTTSIKETEQEMRRFPADVVILDHGIHDDEKAGVELLPVLKGISPNSRFIIFSNYSQYDLQDEALRLGADDYLVKINTPPEQLVSFLRRLENR